MPKRIIPYVLALIQGLKCTSTSIQTQFGYSHDRLTRVLARKCNWQLILIWVIHQWFGFLDHGWLIIDDTVIAKPYAQNLGRAKKHYSSCIEDYVYGYNIIFIVWTDGLITIPLVWAFYQKETNGLTKVDLAKKLLFQLKHLWKLNPEGVLFDSWYGATRILNQIQKYGWKFVFKVKKNRVVNACSISEDLVGYEDSLIGPLTGLVIAKVLKHGNRYFATNDLSLTDNQILSLYGMRWKIEDFFRFLKVELHLEECQARTFTAQETHLGCCMLAYLLIQKENSEQSTERSLYAIKRDWQLNHSLSSNRFYYFVKELETA